MDDLEAELDAILAKRDPVRRQHYVPQFYLRHFVDDHGRLAVLNLDERQILAKRHSPRGVCFADYFYGNKTGVPDKASQVVELMMEELETKSSRLMPDLVHLSPST